MSKRRKKQLLKFLFFLILTIFIIFSFNHRQKKEDKPIDSIETKTTYVNEVHHTVSLEPEIEEKVIEYMDVYYKAMQQLENIDMTYLFTSKDSEQARMNQTALSLLVEIRSLKPNDLRLADAKYDLDIQSVTNKGDTVSVKVLESNYLHFNFMKEIESRVYNIENNFIFEKVDGTYKIKAYNKVQDFFLMITDIYKGKGNFDEIKENYLKIVKEKVRQNEIDYQNYLNNTGITRRTCDHGYDREKALEYAKKWVNTRNSDWSSFDSNCQNFASQVLYTGGIPMDYSGSADDFLQWKFYDSSYNEKQVPKGYVYTWTSVTRFYQYAKNNTGSGLCASVDTNLYYAESGDVVHVGIDGPNRHAFVVIGPYKKEDKVVDILVNSNSINLENYPATAYVYPYASLIKIYGYND